MKQEFVSQRIIRITDLVPTFDPQYNDDSSSTLLDMSHMDDVRASSLFHWLPWSTLPARLPPNNFASARHTRAYELQLPLILMR